MAARHMKFTTRSMILLAGLAMIAAPALSQDAVPAPAPAPAPAAQPAPAPWAPKWSAQELRTIGEMMIGSWQSAEVAQSGGEAGAKTSITMHISPIVAADLTDTLYVEIARTDSQWRPYRQAIFQLYSYKGGVRLRTYEITSSPKLSPAMVGLWLAPELLPQIKRDDLIATIDIDLKPEGAGFAGSSPYAYPTGAGGAVEMTSSIRIGKDSIESADRGFAADGSIVWGSSEAEKYTFSRVTPAAKITKMDGGLARIDFRPAKSGATLIADGDSVAAHYTGWLASNATVFDSSRDRNPLVFKQGTLIEGWNKGLVGLGTESIVRLVIPAALGYGDRGAGRIIPPGAALVFEIEIMDVQKAEAPPPVNTTPTAELKAAEGQQQPAQSQPTQTQPAQTEPAAAPK